VFLQNVLSPLLYHKQELPKLSKILHITMVIKVAWGSPTSHFSVHGNKGSLGIPSHFNMHGNKGSLGIPNQSLQSAEAYVVLHVKCPLFFSGVKKSWSNWRCHERVELYLHNPFFMVLCSLSVGDFLDAFGPGKVPMVSSCEHLWVP